MVERNILSEHVYFLNLQLVALGYNTKKKLAKERKFTLAAASQQLGLLEKEGFLIGSPEEEAKKGNGRVWKIDTEYILKKLYEVIDDKLQKEIDYGRTSVSEKPDAEKLRKNKYSEAHISLVLEINKRVKSDLNENYREAKKLIGKWNPKEQKKIINLLYNSLTYVDTPHRKISIEQFFDHFIENFLLLRGRWNKQADSMVIKKIQKLRELKVRHAPVPTYLFLPGQFQNFIEY